MNIPDPQNIDFGLMLGIPKERQKEISKMLDEMMVTDKTVMVYSSSIIRYLEERLNTKEELFYAFINHMYFCLIKHKAVSPLIAQSYHEAYPVSDLGTKN